MKFDLDNLNPGSWFYFDDDPEKGGVCVRKLSSDALSRFHRECTTVVKRFKKGKPYEDKKFDEDKYDLKFWDYVIVEWKKVEAEDGTPIPCSPENKKKLATESPFFQRFIAECMDKIEEAEGEQKEAAEKN